MPYTAIDPIPKQGKFRRALAAVGVWLQALDYTGFDYTLDRIERLEQELARLKEELRQSREAISSDAHLGGAVNLEH
jgi:HAMP domain-containing protein